MRRSRGAVILLILVIGVIAGFALLQTSAAVTWTLLLLSTIYVPSLLGTVARIVHRDPQVTRRSAAGAVLTDVRDSLLLGTMNLVRKEVMVLEHDPRPRNPVAPTPAPQLAKLVEA